MKALAVALLTLALPLQSMDVVALPGKSPIVTFRIAFRAGAASDPAAKPGAAALTAAMLARGGSKQMPYKQIVDALYPIASSVNDQVDKELTVFVAETHVDNLETFYPILRQMLLEPGWREDDLTRLRDDATNYLRVSLRGNNDEELGKEVLYNRIYREHPYGHHNAGAAAGIASLTAADLQAFYKQHYTRANLILGLAGGYPESFRKRVEQDFGKLPAGTPTAVKLADPKPIEGTQLTMVEKQTRSVAYSIGFPINVTRSHPDYAALLVAQSYLGQHRSSGGHLYQRMRELRGLNYGDYAYIEYFPGGMFRFEPAPNLVRRQQIFQLWIRPVEPPTALFALRLAMFELNKFVRDGLSAEEFEKSRSFLSKYVNLLTKTKSAELGYAIDSKLYGIGPYTEHMKKSLAKLTLDEVNRAIRKHLRASNVEIVAIGQNMAEFEKKLRANEPSPMKYNAAKPPDVIEEDKVVEKLKIDIKESRIIPVNTVFE